MNFKRFHESKNLFDYSTITTGYRIMWTNGEPYADETAIMSDYIPVGIGNYSADSGYFIIGYDANKNYVGTYQNDSSWQKGVTYIRNTFYINANSNVSFVKILSFSTSTPISSTTMLNTGSQPLPYEPYSSEVWHDIPHYIHNTSTDTITTLPADVYANDTTATVGLKGNMSQSSQPSPTTPIQPQECGERMENEWNVTLLPNSSISSENYWEKYDSSTVSTTMYMPCEGNTTYYLYTPNSITSGIFRVYTSASNSVPAEWGKIAVTEKIRSSSPVSVFKFTTGTDDKMIIVQVTTANSQTMADNAVLDKGYKIPILSNSTTTNIYLGEVQSTRQIKKLVFDGTEDWWGSPYAPIPSLKRYGLTLSSTAIIGSTDVLCTHYVATTVSNDSIQIGSNMRSLYISDKENGTTLSDWKTYLAQQYAAGTPVTVWYILATPETAVVNEPLRKIGDYADEVSGITIPTIAGANTLSIGTTLQPSEVTATYKGWHPVQSVHERESGAWD